MTPYLRIRQPAIHFGGGSITPSLSQPGSKGICILDCGGCHRVGAVSPLDRLIGHVCFRVQTFGISEATPELAIPRPGDRKEAPGGHAFDLMASRDFRA
jgi:hypothetical protein